MSGNFLRTYEAELQDRVPGIQRKIGIQALLNAMRSRTLQRNNALQAPLVPVIDLDGDLESRPVAGSVSWDNAMYTLFRRSFPFAAPRESRFWERLDRSRRYGGVYYGNEYLDAMMSAA